MELSTYRACRFRKAQNYLLQKYFADPEPVPAQSFRSDQDYVNIAQILTEQAATGTLKLVPPSIWTESQEARRTLMHAVRFSIQGLRFALPRALDGATECQLRPLVEVQDVPLLGQPTPAATSAGRPGVGEAKLIPNIGASCGGSAI